MIVSRCSGIGPPSGIVLETFFFGCRSSSTSNSPLYCLIYVYLLQARLVNKPHDPNSYIPFACQTLAAPACYALHYSLGPPQFDWRKLKEPVRLNCRDETLQLLAEPQVRYIILFIYIWYGIWYVYIYIIVWESPPQFDWKIKGARPAQLPRRNATIVGRDSGKIYYYTHTYTIEI